MKKQGFYNHKKPRKLLDQVSDVMRMKHYLSRAELFYISWNKLLDREQDIALRKPTYRR